MLPLRGLLGLFLVGVGWLVIYELSGHVYFIIKDVSKVSHVIDMLCVFITLLVVGYFLLNLIRRLSV